MSSQPLSLDFHSPPSKASLKRKKGAEEFPSLEKLIKRLWTRAVIRKADQKPGKEKEKEVGKVE